MNDERRTMKGEYGMFWDAAVHEGIAYFFRWLGEPRATVLAIYNDDELTHVEARKKGDVVLSTDEAGPITREVIAEFTRAKFAYRPGHLG